MDETVGEIDYQTRCLSISQIDLLKMAVEIAVLSCNWNILFKAIIAQ